MLLIDEDICIEDEDKILKEVSKFYEALFQSVGESTKVLAALKELLQYTTTWVSKAQREEIERMPTDEELQKTLIALPKGKSPRLDGMTSEAS